MPNADVLIIGDGPAGLSAALFLAKNDMSVAVFGQNRTPMQKAMLYNYLGIPEMTGSEFQRVGRRQVTDHGGTILDAAVKSAEKTPAGFTLTTEDGERHEAKYLIIASGASHELAEGLGLSKDESGGIPANRDGTTGVPGLMLAGWVTRPAQVQAIISAGDGAAAALSILSAEAGKNFHDFDVV